MLPTSHGPCLLRHPANKHPATTGCSLSGSPSTRRSTDQLRLRAHRAAVLAAAAAAAAAANRGPAEPKRRHPSLSCRCTWHLCKAVPRAGPAVAAAVAVRPAVAAAAAVAVVGAVALRCPRGWAACKCPCLQRPTKSTDLCRWEGRPQGSGHEGRGLVLGVVTQPARPYSPNVTLRSRRHCATHPSNEPRSSHIHPLVPCGRSYQSEFFHPEPLSRPKSARTGPRRRGAARLDAAA
jgi:hypothetical protein